MKINYEAYKDPDLIPLVEIADLLGLEHGKNGKYLCPCHDDHTPSMQIDQTGKYANQFRCWSCGENGGPLELVMAVQSNIMPSDAGRQKYWKERHSAARWIEKYYPGAIANDKEEKYRGDQIPDISPRVLKYIGLKPSIILQHNSGRDPIPLSDAELVTMICDCIYTKEDELSKYLEKIVIKNFPKLSKEGRQYIMHTIAQKQEELEKLGDVCKEYLLRVHFITYQFEPYSQEQEQLFISKNIDALAELHQIDPRFPVLPANLVGQIGRKLPVFKLKDEISVTDIADMLSNTLLDVATDIQKYRIRLYKEFPKIPETDKKYIHDLLWKNEQVLNRYYIMLDQYLSNEIETEYEKE